MPRSIWSGAISFGLVNVPVRMFSAISEHRLHFNYVHTEDGSPIGYAKYCKEEDRPVDDAEIAKAFEWDGEYVMLSDEDFERAQEETFKTIDIKDFVDYSEIDPAFFERTYYLAPDEGGEKVYALLARAMGDSGRAAIAKFAMRDRQHLGCLRVRDGVLVLERMHFADEVRDPGEVAPEKSPRVEKQELELAHDLIGRLSGPFEPDKYEDTYRDTLCEIIKERREGGEVEKPRPKRPEKAPDLMDALKASLEGRGDGGAGDGELSGLSKDELYERAKKADIAGRADMTKDELARALQSA